MSEEFWVSSPVVLLTDFRFLPSSSMSDNQKLNALTRLILIITVIMYYMNYENWKYFIVIGLIIVLVLRIQSNGSSTLVANFQHIHNPLVSKKSEIHEEDDQETCGMCADDVTVFEPLVMKQQQKEEKKPEEKKKRRIRFK